MREIIRMRFGSDLYGTMTPGSDTDIAGVFLPSKEDILLGHIPKHVIHHTGNDRSKNMSGDQDVDIFSLHHFIKMACDGVCSIGYATRTRRVLAYQ
jgi:predicted nucleotidyltransferase